MSPGFLLDTNVASELIRSNPEPRVAEWVYSKPQDSLFLSVITLGELRKGIALLADGKRKTELQRWFQDALVPSFSGRIVPVTERIGSQWGLFTAKRQSAGRPLAAADGLIAATASEHDLVLVTRNSKDFTGLDISLLNPWFAAQEYNQPIQK